MSTTTNTMGGVGRSLGYQYDAGGNRTRLTHGDGVYFDYARDAAGRMTGASWWTAATGTVPFFGISYDDLGRRTGTGTGRASSTSGYGYDAASRLASVTQSFAGAGGTTATFGYNPAGQIASKSQSNDDYAFTGSYNVDRAYATNGLNQHTSAGPATFSYDANGNLTGDGTHVYGYDAENRLVSSGAVTLSYDPLGRLWQTAGGAYGNTQFVYDGDSLVAENDGDTGGMRRRYFHGPGTDEPVLWDEGASMNCSGTKVLHGDERGSIVALADCFGNRVAVNTYDEYGILGSGNTGRFRYTGQAWIPELGLYYYKARMYSPTLGRFMQTDPIGYGDGMNWYNYVGSDPVNFVDPSGLHCDTPKAEQADLSEADCKKVGGAYYDDIIVTAVRNDSGGGWGGAPSGPQNGGYIFACRAPMTCGTGGETAQNDDIVVTGERHKYVIPLLNPCSASAVFGYFKQAGHSAPGAPAITHEGLTRRLVLTGGNPISQFVDSSSGTIINTTLPGHRYYSGTVTIQVTPLSAQTSTTVITGEGTGAHAEENVILGEAFFGSQGAGAMNVCGR